MTKEEKKLFIDDIMDNIRQDIISKLDKIPESWSGRELRMYIVERTAEIKMPVSLVEKRRYQADVINNDL